MKKIKKIISTLSVALVLVSHSVWAGVVLESTGQGLNNEVVNTKIYIDKNAFRAEAGPDATVIFKKDAQAAYILNNKTKTYMEMSKASMAPMMDKMNQAMKMMEEQMKNMPPKQREAMEKLMKESNPNFQMPQGSQPLEKTVYKNTGIKEMVGSWSATKYEGMRGTQKVSDIWTVPAEELGLGATDMEVMTSYAAFVKDFMKGANMGMFADMIGIPSATDFVGFPVKSTLYINGTPTTGTVTGVKKQDLDMALFAIPADFTKQKMPMGEMN